MSIFQIKVVHVCSTWIATFFYLFSNELVYGNTFQKTHHFTAIVASISVTYFVLFGHVIAGAEPIGNLPNWTVPGPQFYIYLIHYGFYTSVAIIYCALGYFKGNDGQKRFQYLYIFAGTLLGLLGGWTAFLPGFGIKIEPYGLFFIFVFQFMVGISILKYHAFDIKATVPKFSANLITGIGLIFVSMLLIYIISQITITKIDLKLTVFTFVIAGLAGYFFDLIRDFLDTSLKHIFIKGYYNPESEFSRISEQLENVDNVGTAIGQTGKALDDVLQVDTVYWIIKDETSESPKFCTYLDDEKIADVTNTLENPVLRYVDSQSTVTSYEDLPAPVKEFLTTSGFGKGVLIPCHSPEGLEGVIYLGDRSGGKRYTPDDIKFIHWISRQLHNLFYKLTPYEHLVTEFRKTKEKLFDANLQLARSSAIEAFAHRNGWVLYFYIHTININWGRLQTVKA